MRTPTHPYPLTHKFIQSTGELWKAFIRHDFVVQLGKGTLDRLSFIHFIKCVYFPTSLVTVCSPYLQTRQDYLFLKYYVGAYA